MTAPSWPRLAARLLRPQVTTVQGRWRTHEAAGTFAHRRPDDWATVDERGRPGEAHDVRLLLRPRFQRDGPRLAAGPVVAVRHDGRAAWQVELVRPDHRRGTLVLTVDDATGLLVRLEDAAAGHLVELVDLVVDHPVADEVFAAQAARARERAREAARLDLARRRPVPTPQWFPWRRSYVDEPGVLVVESDRGTGAVARAPLGRPAPAPEWAGPAQVHRFDARGWSWAVASAPPMTADDARRVVDQVDQRAPGEAPADTPPPGSEPP